MATTSIEFTGEVKFTYDENSPEFQATLADYREACEDETITVEAMLQYVARNLTEWGDHERMIEGIGYVKLEDSNAPKDNYSGISVAPSYDERYYD